MRRDMSRRICQITTVHIRKDGRIFHKECVSLAEQGYDVTLLVNDGRGDECDQGVQLLDIGGYSGRIKRVLGAQPKALIMALRQRADVYHFHDPELIGIGLLLRLLGKRVVYDVHEDLPNDILAKPWIPPLLRKTIAKFSAFMERVAARRFAACVCTTPTIQGRFSASGGRDTVLLRNYPITQAAEPVESSECSGSATDVRLCYAGGISDARGLRQMIELADATQTRLCLMGPIRGVVMEELMALPGWQYVDYLGMLSKEEVEREYCRQPAIGLVILLPGYGYDEALPIKLFEYMLFGLPVVCSHFPLWRSIVSKNDCGIAVDPEDVNQISEVILALKSDPERMLSMAARGRKAVLEKYSWVAERTKLFDLYDRLLQAPDR
jgi:hypothetical protein